MEDTLKELAQHCADQFEQTVVRKQWHQHGADADQGEDDCCDREVGSAAGIDANNPRRPNAEQRHGTDYTAGNPHQRYDKTGPKGGLEPR